MPKGISNKTGLPTALGYRHTEKTKQQISATLNKLYEDPAERAKHASFTGRRHTKETLQRMSAAQSGQNNAMYGRYGMGRKRIVEEGKVKQLYQEYLGGLSLSDLSKKYQILPGTLENTFKYAGHKLRTKAESIKLAGRQGKMKHPQYGENNPCWKGGTYIRDGYVMIWVPELRKYRREHHLVWEQVNNQPLPKGWCVHHLNGIFSDNRPENLEAMPVKKHNNYIPLLKKRIRELEVKVNILQRALESNQMVFTVSEN